MVVNFVSFLTKTDLLLTKINGSLAGQVTVEPFKNAAPKA